MTVKRLEERIAILEDIENIKRLQAEYLYLVDSGNWQELVNLFTENPILDLGPFGCYEGKEDIAGFFKELPRSMPLQIHMCHNPLIKIEGATATGEWYYEVAATEAKTNEAVWIMGKFVTKLVKIGGAWKYKNFTAHCIVNTHYNRGWGLDNACA